MAENDIKDRKSKEKRYMSIGGELIEVDKDTAYISSYLAPPYTPAKALEFSSEWPIEQERPIEIEVKSSAEIDDSEIVEKANLLLIVNKINRLSRQLEKHDTKMTAAADDNAQKLDYLINENKELKELLSQQYTAKGLLHFSVTASIALLVSLFVWLRFGIVIIHPALATISLIGTIGFSILAVWRSHE